MKEEEFTAFLGILIVPQVVKIISDKKNIAVKDAIAMFYNSSVYSFLENENSKFWHYSPLTLYSLFEQEFENGSFVFPEEAA